MDTTLDGKCHSLQKELALALPSPSPLGASPSPYPRPSVRCPRRPRAQPPRREPRLPHTQLVVSEAAKARAQNVELEGEHAKGMAITDCSIAEPPQSPQSPHLRLRYLRVHGRGTACKNRQPCSPPLPTDAPPLPLPSVRLSLFHSTPPPTPALPAPFHPPSRSRSS